ncbi:MAG: hypothetical protein HN820_08175 [Candidatus Marinimicrobia bacterium]|jgi:hypothetical protein|nr:hypothetical protein [Candidatus Neomarinimicrobiota bacterium]
MDQIGDMYAADESVIHLTELSDLGQPYTCSQWANQYGTVHDSESGYDHHEPLIVSAPNAGMFNIFSTGNVTPSNIWIDHTMTVFFKSNTAGFGLINLKIQEMLAQMNEAEEGCIDSSACNYNPDADIDDGSCIYEADCLGECGGDAVDDECGVCNGDNSSCTDCNGVINGDAEVDICGVCDGNETNPDNCSNTLIRIPEDYATIQEGIDASVDGDTVLVADGDYVENLVLNKSIVLASYAIFDNLNEWIIFDDNFLNQWVSNNSHIESTRLIGINPDDPD